ncbi:cyanase [Testudinibacter sp. P27/CKL/0425]
MLKSRLEVTEQIIANKAAKGLKWADIASKLGLSKEWVTAGCLGQMAFSAEQAKLIAEFFELDSEAEKWLQTVPYKGGLPTAVPSDPLLYRLYEVVSVYGPAMKALIHEEFGDGIMSAIDFSMDIQRESHPAGDRVNIVMSGKFLPYKAF